MYHVQKMQKTCETTFMQHLKNNELIINYNYDKSFAILGWKKALQCKFILTSFAWLLINWQKNNCPICYEYLTFTFLSNLPPSIHTLTILLNTCINELYMELVHGQLLQKELQSKSKVLSHCTRQETLTIRGVLEMFKRGVNWKS